MGAYRDLVDADGAYIHYEFQNNYADSEGVATTTGTNYGGSTPPTFGTSEVKGTTAATGMVDFTGADMGKNLGTAAQAQVCFGTALDNNNALSIECWIKFDSDLRTSGTMNIIRSDNGWWFRVNNKHPQLNIRKTSNFDTSWEDTGTALAANTLYHLVATWDGTNIRHYINGALSSTSGSLAGTFTLAASNNATYIGSPGAETMEAALDELAIYRSVLTLSQIQAHYALGIGNVTVAADTTKNVTFSAPAPTVLITSDLLIGVDNAPNVTFAAPAPTLDLQASVTLSNVPDVTYTALSHQISQMEVLKDNPIAFWNFQDGKDSVDVTGNLLMNYAKGGLATDPETVTGREGDAGYKAIHFTHDGASGSTDFARFSMGSELVDEWTVEFWYYNPTTGDQTIWSNQTAAHGSTSISYDESSEELRFTARTENSSSNGTATGTISATGSGVVLEDDTWYHIAVRSTLNAVPTPDEYNVSIFLNGALVATSSATQNHPKFTNRGGTANLGLSYDVGYYVNVNGYYDDVAFYDYSLSDARISVHALGVFDRTVTVDAPPNVTFSAPDPNIGAEFGSIVNATTATAVFTGLTPSIQINDGTNFTPDVVNVTFLGLAPTLISVGHSEQIVENLPVTTFSAPAPLVVTRPDNLEFVWISPTTTEFTARDATSLSSLNFGVLFQGQDRRLAFRLGNTSSIATSFLVYASSLNTTLASYVEFSLDKVDWEETLLIENVGSNSITDVIYVRVTMPNEAIVGSGTFTITVVQDA